MRLICRQSASDPASRFHRTVAQLTCAFQEIAGGDYLVDIKVGTPDNVPKNYTIIQTTPSGKMACLDRKQVRQEGN